MKLLYVMICKIYLFEEYRLEKKTRFMYIQIIASPYHKGTLWSVDRISIQVQLNYRLIQASYKTQTFGHN